MTTQTWHADRDLLTAYVAGALDPVNGASVEQHLEHCAECRENIRPLVDAPMLDQTWSSILRDRREPGAAVPSPSREASGRHGADLDPARRDRVPANCLDQQRVRGAGVRGAGGLLGGRWRPRALPARRPARAGARRRRGVRTQRGPVGVADRDGAVRSHPADPAPHPRRPRLGAPVRDRRRPVRPRTRVARGRLAGARARSGPRDDGAVQLRRPAHRRRCRDHRLERRGAALRPGACRPRGRSS